VTPRLAGTLLVIMALLPWPPAQADESDNNYWGAIAYSQTTGKWGYSRHWLSEVNARRVARDNCKAEDAKVVLVVGNYWCALALGDDVTAYGTGYSKDADEAKKFALAECKKRTTNCKVVLCFNTRDDDL
jgi:hypothetical protein